MADSSSVQRKVETTKDQVRTIQYTKINKAPEDIDALVNELQKVRTAFRAASKMSNIGAKQFDDKLGEVIVKLRGASRLIGNLKL